jgi:hypothetical protein
MKKLTLVFAIFLMTLLSACSSTSKVAIEKKPLMSDHYLMLSLLNRPVTQDQQMMLAFAEQRNDFQNLYFVDAIEIKGQKSEEGSVSRASHSYSNLIAQDFNSVRISGPK